MRLATRRVTVNEVIVLPRRAAEKVARAYARFRWTNILIKPIPVAMTAFTKLNLFVIAVACLVPLHAAVFPSGSQLEVRLLHGVGSRVSHLGDFVEASVITPIFDHGTIVVPTGATVSGVVERVDRLGLGLRHTAARLDLRFTRLNLSDGAIVSIDAHVTSVETAREAVRHSGAVIGIHPSASFSTAVSCFFTLFLFGEPEFRLPILGFKFLAARSPDAEITFPAGAEMLLRLGHDVELTPAANDEVRVPLLAKSQIAEVQNILAALPQQQTNRGRNHPADLVNILIIGSQEEVERTFGAAGWNGAEPRGVMALYRIYHCAVQRMGYSAGPMTSLKLDGNLPDASFQKSLDTFAKRHHIRLWRDTQSGAWLGAATEDVGYTIRKMHLSHATDSHIDNERAKVVNDLVFTGCVDKGALIPRATLKPAQEYGNSILTDGDIAVLQLNACNDPRLMPSHPQTPRPVRAIRAIVAVGEDIARSNPISVGYAMAKSILDNSKIQADERIEATLPYTRPSAVSSVTATTAAGVLALR
jgi:hypothetical protein